MAIICGVDGYRGGWIAAAMDTATNEIEVRPEIRIADIVEGRWSPAVVALDMPIGLPDSGPRQCDLDARKLLSPTRSSSVFPAPPRSVLDATDYEDACRRRFEIEGKKISKQTYAILPKIREVDAYVRAYDPKQQRIREVHPELSLATLNGGSAMQANKRKPEGRRERMALLEPIFGDSVDRTLSNRNEFMGVGVDDIIDAFAALWTAQRIFNNTAMTIPAQPALDRHGLRMEMVA